MFTKIYQKAQVLVSKNSKIIYFILFFTVILLALFPRSIEVINGNPIFGFDQGRDYLVVKSIVLDHKLTLIGAELGAGAAGILGVFQGPFYYYLLCIPFILFNGNPTGGTFLMLLLGLSCVAFIFFFAKKLFGDWIALLAAFLISISPFFISQSRFIWNPNTSTLFVLLSFFFIYQFYKKNSVYVFLSSFFAGFIYNFEFAVSIPICVCLFIYSVIYFRKKIKSILVLLSGFAVAFSPFIFFEIRHNFLAFRNLILYSGEKNPLYSPSFYQNLFLDHIKSYIYSIQGLLPFEFFIFSAIFLVIVLILSIYFVKKEKNKPLKNFLTFLLFLFPTSFVIFSFLKNTVWVYYLTELSLSYVFFISYVYFKFWQKKNLFLRLSLIIFIFVIGVVALRNQIKISTYDYSDYGGTAKLKGKTDAIDFIYKDADKKPFGIMFFSPPIYTYPYEYLIGWYGKDKYGYVPYDDKKGEFYLLIEPDHDKPWTYNGWIETVIKSGRVEWTKNLPSGFIVQKRISI